MSSREDSSAGSDSELDPGGSSADLSKLAEIPSIDPASFPLMFSTPLQTLESVGAPPKGRDGPPAAPQRCWSVRRSLSEGETAVCDGARCPRKKCHREEATTEVDERPKVFPSLTDALLEASGIANLADSELDRSEELSESELERKYTALSVGIATDRITLRRRMGLSIRQRDQAERNLAHEVQKMQQDIQEGPAKQRNSVSGRIGVRRPSLSSESHKSLESEKPQRADGSASGIGELKDISERTESKRDCREENNNSTRLSASVGSARDTMASEAKRKAEDGSTLPEELCRERETSTSQPKSLSVAQSLLPWRSVLWCVLIFFFGFYVKHVISSVRTCNGYPYKWWSVDEILGRYLRLEDAAPRPV